MVLFFWAIGKFGARVRPVILFVVSRRYKFFLFFQTFFPLLYFYCASMCVNLYCFFACINIYLFRVGSSRFWFVCTLAYCYLIRRVSLALSLAYHCICINICFCLLFSYFHCDSSSSNGAWIPITGLMFLVSASASVIWCIYKKHFVYKISILNSEYSQIFVKKRRTRKSKIYFCVWILMRGKTEASVPDSTRCRRALPLGWVWSWCSFVLLVYVLLFSALTN